jgi:hypothetical protein
MPMTITERSDDTLDVSKDLPDFGSALPNVGERNQSSRLWLHERQGVNFDTTH